MYAIVETGGKQYKVSANDIVKVEKLEANVGDKVNLNVLMLVDGAKWLMVTLMLQMQKLLLKL